MIRLSSILLPLSYVGTALTLVGTSAANTSHPTAESTAFVIRSFAGGPSPKDLLQRSTVLRREIATQWLSHDERTDWQPRCMVVVHPTKQSYLQAVGPHGTSTLGSSQIRTQHKRIVLRRIDLLCDGKGDCPALAHELTHVVLADWYHGRQPPRWLDEGIAILSDTPEKQTLHQRDLFLALHSGSLIDMPELLTTTQLRSSQQVAPFYGQSHSIVQFLRERSDARTLLRFADTAMKHGYDYALSHHYAFANLAEFERHWYLYVTSASANNSLSLPISSLQNSSR